MKVWKLVALVGTCSVVALSAIGAMGGSEERRQADAQELRIKQQEQRRDDLIQQKDRLVLDLLKLTADNPAAMAGAMVSLGSLGASLEQSLTQDQRNAFAAIGVIGGSLCLLDSDCRTTMFGIVKLIKSAQDLQQQIDGITNDIGRRVYVKNSCAAPVRVAIGNQDLGGAWRDRGWWAFKAQEGGELLFGGYPIRTRQAKVAFFAESTDGNRPMKWDGKVELHYGDTVVKGREATLSAAGDNAYQLELTCNI